MTFVSNILTSINVGPAQSFFAFPTRPTIIKTNCLLWPDFFWQKRIMGLGAVWNRNRYWINYWPQYSTISKSEMQRLNLILLISPNTWTLLIYSKDLLAPQILVQRLHFNFALCTVGNFDQRWLLFISQKLHTCWFIMLSNRREHGTQMVNVCLTRSARRGEFGHLLCSDNCLQSIDKGHTVVSSTTEGNSSRHI